MLSSEGSGETEARGLPRPVVIAHPVPRLYPVVSGLGGLFGTPGHSLSTSTGHSSAVPMWLSSSVMMMFSMSFMERCSQKVSYSSRFSSSTVSFCMSHCGERAGGWGGADPAVGGAQ